ncbi:hypothetical protein CVT25_015893 [Psilocybe cyanescens]|uniref:Uncharacterized protein n=1 Tax=Psilocybe cyanescens TaxID=93625 RepID=A0A409WS90_PSICY|nr:hypothetical protein CVT25_015893 [Psilocybe cyanescens]
MPTSTPTPTPPQIQIQMPELDLPALAKTTRKSLDRLASFSNMQSASDPLPVLTKISTKIHALIRLIDASMLAAQLGYRLATDAMLLCESTLIVIDSELGEWDAGVSVDIDMLRETCRSGCENAGKVADGFRDVRQEAYKIAAATKDNMFIVLVPPDRNSSATMKIHLKDIGTGLVANLNLLSDFVRAVTNVSEWWVFVKEDLESPKPTLIPSPSSPTPYTQDEVRNMHTRWTSLKEGFQQYYDVISVAQERYPDLLPSSSAAWTAVTTARSAAPSSLGHDEKDKEQQNHASLVRGRARTIAKGMHAMLDRIVGLRMKHPAASGGGKGKEKEKDIVDSDNPQLGPMSRSNSTGPSTGFYRSGTPSSSSSRSSSLSLRGPGSHGEHEKRTRRGGSPGGIKSASPFSCCSVSLFGEDDVSRLGSHVGGFMIR